MNNKQQSRAGAHAQIRAQQTLTPAGGACTDLSSALTHSSRGRVHRPELSKHSLQQGACIQTSARQTLTPARGACTDLSSEQTFTPARDLAEKAPESKQKEKDTRKWNAHQETRRTWMPPHHMREKRSSEGEHKSSARGWALWRDFWTTTDDTGQCLKLHGKEAQSQEYKALKEHQAHKR